MRPLIGALLVAAGVMAGGASVRAQALLPSGPDPWVAQRDGVYYYMNTMGDRIAIRKTTDLQKLRDAPPVTVWTPPASGPNSAAVWAPELHYLDGKWYLYYTAADKQHNDDAHRHIFVLENAAADPTTGTWVDKGMLATHLNGIDGTVFEYQGNRYFAYSAYVGDHSDLVLAPMPNPWTLGKPQVDIATPTFTWEMQGGRKILEGPEFIEGPDGTAYLSYSGSACWADGYSIGLLTAAKGANLLASATWVKSPKPVMASSPRNNVYAPGHNGFFKSPDGKTDWIIYHANGGPDWKCTARRAPHAQPLSWDPRGKPIFPEPR
ncbi:glycoside hydrolase family 43 protein [Luteibacter aegosomaticola]|uniref:glycoside hydrolase family 43 protein n=1 Tax=Luteibacter aegosomaticola TaxID=2911538 RepID=UPI001FF7752D|nr:glycoside hydrolase family 43 protein [Luteibacter aegosomaticola]UPG91187.1 glycoside hydrolase family 43 protein [Luteibacter aegosomaticola]